MSKSHEIYISEHRARSILIYEGNFTLEQAEIVLSHSLKQAYNGHNYYPPSYIYKRAKEHASKPENDANKVSNYD